MCRDGHCRHFVEPSRKRDLRNDSPARIHRQTPRLLIDHAVQRNTACCNQSVQSGIGSKTQGESLLLGYRPGYGFRWRCWCLFLNHGLVCFLPQLTFNRCYFVMILIQLLLRFQ